MFLTLIILICLLSLSQSFVARPLLSLSVTVERKLTYDHRHHHHHLTTGRLMLQQRYNKMPLCIDLFGLGPSEIVIIIGAGLLLYGPDRVKQQLRDSGVKGKIVSAGWKAERLERISEMEEYAEKVRKSRSRRREIQQLEEEIGESE